MTYTRPTKVDLPDKYSGAKNIYSRMAIYFDLHINDTDRDDSTLFQYLYHISYMLACKKDYFQSWATCDKFALYMAEKIYMRYISPKSDSAEPIKSVLNYCKALLYPTKVDFQNEYFAEIMGSDPNSEFDFTKLSNSLRESVQDSHLNKEFLRESIIEEFKGLPGIIRGEIAKMPYTNDKVLSHRLFMSVLITMVKGVTLSPQSEAKLRKRQEKGLDCDSMLTELFTKERESSLTLWRLDSKYSNIVSLLTTKTRKACGNGIGMVRKDFDLSEDDVDAVLASAYGNIIRDDGEEM